ncbi:MAG: CusA/CzcA family heavy metal efflux RND transporter [Burkholderiales bacterium]|nr:CusA/CzcA family heavy metal efflux RND transporter [Burkholderiales bacterium]
MLTRIVEFSLTQRLLVLVMTALLIGAGIYAFEELPIDAFPDVSTTQVKVIMKAPGMTPEEVEARIASPIELEMLGIPKKRIVRSKSKYALADITIDFDEGTDIYWARNQVAERLNSVALPPGVMGGLAPITTPLGEMFMFTIEGGNLSLMERRSLLDWVIRPALRTLPGVADVNSLGGLVRTFEVSPVTSNMHARNISGEMLQRALEENNRNDGAGRLTEGEETLLVRAAGSIKSLEDVRNIVVTTNQEGIPIRVGDVADVRIGSLTRYGAVTKDGKGEVVEGLVLGLMGSNAQKVVREVQAKLDQMAPSFPRGVRATVFYNRGNLVERAIETVSRSLIEAIVLVIVLLLLFLGNIRAALSVAFALPLAALITFMLMKSAGMSANLMSLGGLSIAIGILIDGAVVVVENIVTHLSHQNSKLPGLHLVYRATKEVTLPVASGVMIIIIVFLPLLTLQGLEGKLFIPVALSIVFALSGSLLLAMTIIPVLSSMLMREASHEEPWLVRNATRIYEPVLSWALLHSKIVIALAVFFLMLTIGAYTLIGKTFMPVMDEGDIIMQIEKLPSISLETSAALDERIQKKILASVPEVRHIIARTGSDELGLDPMGLNQTDTFMVLAPKSSWRRPDKEWVIGEIRQVMQDFPGVTYSFTQPIEMRVAEMLTGVRGDIAIKIFGPDLGELDRLAAQMVSTLKKIHGAEDVFTPRNTGVQYYQVEIDRLAAGRMGLSVDGIENTLRGKIEGRQIGVILENVRRTPLVLRGSEELRNSPALFANLRLALPNGQSVPISTVAKLERTSGPVTIEHENAGRMIVVQSNVSGRDLVGFVEEAKRDAASKISFPAGYTTEWGGQFENQQRAAARLALVVPVALLLIFLILFATFGSVRQSILVFANIPFALIGGVFALLVSGQYLSVPASVGFIALLGIAVLNGVMLVSYFNQLRAQGMAVDRLVVEGAKRRLRPVLMTASITAFGLVPQLFASGPGSEIQKPLAVVVIGGLITSTLLTLIILPILYRRFGMEPGSPK